MTVLKHAMLALALALAPLVAQAQGTYRCVGSDGKKYYGSTIPQACQGQPIEQLSPSGTVIRRIDRAGDEKMRAVKEAEAAKKREEDAIAREASRRNRALLATYTSEKDIKEARGRALAENEKASKEVEQRIRGIKQRKAGYDKEMELYAEVTAKGGPGAPALQAKSATKPPPKLLDDTRDADVELAAQESLLAVKRKEVDSINARYDQDNSRYLELTGKNAAERGKALGMDKGVTVTSKPGSTIDEIRNEREAQRRAREERQELENIERSRGRNVRQLGR